MSSKTMSHTCKWAHLFYNMMTSYRKWNRKWSAGIRFLCWIGITGFADFTEYWISHVNESRSNAAIAKTPVFKNLREEDDDYGSPTQRDIYLTRTYECPSQFFGKRLSYFFLILSTNILRGFSEFLQYNFSSRHHSNLRIDLFE